MDGRTAGGGAWRCVVGGRGEGLRRAAGVACGRMLLQRGARGRGSAWCSGPGAGQVWALAAEFTPSQERALLAPGRAGLAGRGLGRGAGQLGNNSPWGSAPERGRRI